LVEQGTISVKQAMALVKLVIMALVGLGWISVGRVTILVGMCQDTLIRQCTIFINDRKGDIIFVFLFVHLLV